MSKKILENILDYANRLEARRLVFDPKKEGLNLEYHLQDGSRKQMALPAKLSHEFMDSLYRILDLSQGDLVSGKYHKIKHHDNVLPLYLSVLPSQEGEKIVIEMASHSLPSLRLNQLGMTATDRKLVRTALKGRGLIIVSSPSRQGRSTTLHALAAEIDADRFNAYFLGNSRPKRIKINHLYNTPSNWTRLRQHDSDIIIADTEQDWVLSEAILTAATGRLVVITLKAKDSKEVANKIKGLKLPKSLIAGSIKLIITGSLEDWKHGAAKKSLTRDKIGRFKVIKIKKS